MKKNSLKLLVLTMALIISAPVFAAQNVIQSVIISKSKDNPQAYELSIDSTDEVQYKTKVNEDGSVYFDLKNSVVAPNLGTVYDDVADIDNVVVRQFEKNKVRIYVKGKNAKNTELVFVNSLFETKNSSKKVVINKPASDYQPTKIDYDDLENQEDIQEWDDNSFNFSHLLASFLGDLKEGPLGIVLIILSIFAFIVFMLKSLASKLSQDSEPLIGLNQNFNKKSAALSYPKNSMQDINRDATIKNAQMELMKAHQKYQSYISTKYQSKPKQTNINPVQKSIGINQYQKSNKNPYTDQQVIKIKKDYNYENDFRIPPRPKNTQQVEKFTSPYIKRTNSTTSTVPQQKQNVKPTNMKFLESVSKIYQQAGREDLANELKNSMSKVKQSI